MTFITFNAPLSFGMPLIFFIVTYEKAKINTYLNILIIACEDAKVGCPKGQNVILSYF